MNMHMQQFRQLLSLTQSYLLDEFTSKDWVATDEESFHFFQKYHPLHEHKNAAPPTAPTSQFRPAPPPPALQQPSRVIPPSAPSVPQMTRPASLPSVEPPKREMPHATPPSPPPPAATPEVAQAVESPPKAKAAVITLEPLPAAPKFEYEKIYNTYHTLFPNLPLATQIPDDAVAKKIGNRWKKENIEPEIVILSFNEPAQSKCFLNNLTQAIHQHLKPAVIYPAYLIEQKDKWDQLLAMPKLKLIITTDFGMYSLPKLMRFYKESPNKNIKYLGDIPVLLIADPAIYLKQPNLKSSLWRALTSLLELSR